MPRILGDAGAGKAIFVANCRSCHTLRAAGADGRLGPDLATLSLPEATIIRRLLNGDPALPGSARGRYPMRMIAYRGVLATAQIDDVAAFVYTVPNP